MPEVLAAWDALRGLRVYDCADAGLINRTLLAGDPPAFVVQRLNPIFAPTVHDDIEAVTAHLAAKGLRTPRLVRTLGGELCALDPEGAAWRVMDFVPGVTVHRVDSTARAHAAGALVGRFHRAVDDLDWDYHHVRPGAHDTALHMRNLDAAVTAGDARHLADAILAAWSTWDGDLHLPARHAHGDLKLSNLRFTAGGEGLCLLDLDTLSRQPLDVELGDAWRSWCNPVGEDAVETHFDADIFAAALGGYLGERTLSRPERQALGGAVERISLELAARFCRDVAEDRYFGWDPRRFPSRAAHNLFRARGQYNLACSARAQRRAIDALLAAR